MIYKMTADILFDREITNHYISPGGYEISDKEGNNVQFDFETYYGFIDDVDRRVLHIDVQTLDLSSFPGAASLESAIRCIDCFTEFFIYTGEETDPEIKTARISNVKFFTDDGEELCVKEECLDYCNYL